MLEHKTTVLTLCTLAVLTATGPLAAQFIIQSSPIRLNASGTLIIQGSSQSDYATVAYSGRYVVGRLGRVSRSYSRRLVKEISFSGGYGNDQFRNWTSLPSYAAGGSGSDVLIGGSGPDRLLGGYGNDHLNGGSGDDHIRGGSGNDVLIGGYGNDDLSGDSGSDWIGGDAGDDRLFGGSGYDTLKGGTGRDELFGGPDADWMYGESGQDVLVSIGGGTDRLYGGSYWDSFWMDPTDLLYDSSPNERNKGYVHKVYSFDPLHHPFSTWVFWVSKELSGQSLLDPYLRVRHDPLPLKSFRSNPLFARGGPSKDDILQGQVGDCYFVAALSALAYKHPEHIRKMVVDLGDGTYAVRFMKDGNEHYIRVDADLYVDGSEPKYAGLGQEDSIWVPIVEKAYAFFRRGAGTYDSIGSGDGTAPMHLDYSKSGYMVADADTPGLVALWFALGSATGGIKDRIQANVESFLRLVKDKLSAGKAMTMGAVSGVTDATAIVYAPGDKSNTFRRGQHIYVVVRVLVDAQGTPTGLVLRNPYTNDPLTLMDFTRIYFCLGRVGVLTPNR